MNADTFTESLLAFIGRDLLGASEPSVDEDTYLFGEGGIDSLKILRLVAFIEQATGRAIPESDIVMKHFRSVRAIVQHFSRPSADHVEPVVS
jgi:acyl carrier protein